MSAERKGRRWLTAVGVTVGAHLLVFTGLVVGTPKWKPIAETQVFQVTLDRERPVPAPPKVTAAPRPAAQTPLQVHQPPVAAPSVPNSGFAPAQPSGPPVAAPAPPTPAPAPAPAAKLKLDCLHMGPAARRGVYGREDCEVQKYADPGWRNKQFAVPDNPAWDAEVASRMTKHQPLPPDKPFRNACANSNLGLGCTDDMLVPLVKKPF